MLLEDYFLTHILFRWVAYSSPTRGWDVACSSPKNQDHKLPSSVYLRLNLPYPGCLGWSVHNSTFSKVTHSSQRPIESMPLMDVSKVPLFSGSRGGYWLLCPCRRYPGNFTNSLWRKFYLCGGLGKCGVLCPGYVGKMVEMRYRPHEVLSHIASKLRFLGSARHCVWMGYTVAPHLPSI